VVQPLRVLWLIKGLGLGGAEVLLARAVPHIDRSRFSVEMAYVLPHKNALVGEFEREGIPVHCLGPGLRWVSRLARLLREERFDVVHVHSPIPAVAARLLLRLRGKRARLVYTEHNIWGRYHRATRWANAATYRLNDHTFAVSDAVLKSVRVRGSRAPEVVHEGIDFDRVIDRGPCPLSDEFGIPDGVPVVGTIANLKPHKGLDRLAAVARQVAAEFPDVVFVVVGTGPEEATLREAAADAGVADRFVLTGFRADALDLAQRFDVFALPSMAEGFPISVLEAMALGRPCVVTNVGGVPDAIEHGTHGFLVEPDEVEEFANYVVALIRDPELGARLGSAARERARDFNNATAIRRREAVYEALVPA
jgi:glycosyltransferase involved in cell wall biosynthesis